jgi:hypothetical protein
VARSYFERATRRLAEIVWNDDVTTRPDIAASSLHGTDPATEIAALLAAEAAAPADSMPAD